MSKGIFITGTGTDVGKTYVCALLVKQLREFGLDCGYYKPVLSGAIEQEGQLILGDIQYVLNEARISDNPMRYVSYYFKDAVSPHLAAKRVSSKIKLQKIVDDYNSHSERNQFTVVEGAGGVICPLDLDENLFIYDIPEVLGLDVIIVADSALGTINNTFLTVKFLKELGVNIVGVILNNYDFTNFVHVDNKDTIEKICGVEVIGTVSPNADFIELKNDLKKVLYE